MTCSSNNSNQLNHKNADRNQIRQQIRQRRQQLTPQQQQQFSQQLLQQLQTLSAIQDAKNIAIYLSNDGEINTQACIEWLWQQGKNVLLPVLHPFSAGHLLFLHYRPDSQLISNKYGIIEPKLAQTEVCPITDIDIIFTPLVAFDQHGQRLGMGGGYYDRTLTAWFNRPQQQTAIGLAHNCQQVDNLPQQTWDIPLPTIVTPEQIWHWENQQIPL